jgi:hypothetical protein
VPPGSLHAAGSASWDSPSFSALTVSAHAAEKTLINKGGVLTQGQRFCLALAASATVCARLAQATSSSGSSSRRSGTSQ